MLICNFSIMFYANNINTILTLALKLYLNNLLDPIYRSNNKKKILSQVIMRVYMYFFLLDKPYLISLQLKCSYSKNYNVQVNVEGNEGTVKFQMSQYCRTWYKWYHAAFSDKDIGELQQVRFMVSIHVPKSFLYINHSHYFSTSSRKLFISICHHHNCSLHI